MKTISQLTNKDCIHCKTEEEGNISLQITVAFTALLLSAIFWVLAFKPYTILIICNDWYMYQRYWMSPITEVKKLEKTLNTGANNIGCEVEMFAR